MATNSPTECSICSEEFNDEERSPRSLPCSHSICTECVQNLIDRNNKICPFCKRTFNASSAKEIGINSACLDVLNMLREMEKRATNLEKELETSYIDWGQQNITKCREAKYCIDFVIQSNCEINKCLAQANHKIEKEIIVKFNQMVVENKERISHLEDQNEVLKSQRELIGLKEKTLVKALHLLEVTGLHKGASLFEKVETINSEAKMWLQNFEDYSMELLKSRQKIKEVVRCTEDKLRNFQMEMEKPVEPKDLELFSNLPLMIIHRIIRQQITVEMLQEKREPVMELIRQEKVYAVQLLEGRQRQCKISVDAINRICLHHLHEDEVSTDVLPLQHGEVLNMVNPSSRLTFLELSDDQRRVLGRIYIRLTPDSKRAKQFSILCTGERGPSYTGTKIRGVGCMGSAPEHVWFGDNELLQDEGSTALVPGALEERGGVFNRPLLMGTVQGKPTCSIASVAAIFNIYTKTIPGKNFDRCFGIVEEGLGILTKALASHRIKDDVISDSGIVIC